MFFGPRKVMPIMLDLAVIGAMVGGELVTVHINAHWKRWRSSSPSVPLGGTVSALGRPLV
jgi:hypothetical protein